MKLGIIPLLLLACGDTKTNSDTDSVEDTSGANDTDIVVGDPSDYDSGCFTVDGGNGFANFNDAMLFTQEGSTITLVDCENLQHEEAWIIDKSISVIGVPDFVLVAPVNETAITIQSDNVSIESLVIESTRSGISIEESDGVTLRNINVIETGNWAVKAIDSNDLVIDSSNFQLNGFGGVSLSGGSTTVTTSDVSNNTAVGIKVEQGGSLSVSNSTFTFNTPTDPTSPSDGIGIWLLDGSDLTSSNNIYDNNFFAGVQSDNSDISLSGDQLTNSIGAGVWTDIGFGTTLLDNVSLTDNMNYGVVSQSSGDFTLLNSTITGDPETSPNHNAEEWRDNGLSGTGLYTSATNVDIQGVEITGYNNCGLYAASEETDATLNLQDSNVHDLGRLGGFVFGYTSTIHNSTFSAISDLDEISATGLYEICYTVDRYAGLVGVSADFTITDGTISQSASYGLSLIDGSATITGTTFSGNKCSSAMIFQSSAEIDQATMEEPNGEYSNFGASVYGYEASLLRVSNSDFQPETSSFNNNFHISLYNTERLEIENNTFTGGYYGVYGVGSEISATGNTFSEQNMYGYAVRVRYDSDPSDSADLQHTFSENTYTTANSGTYGIDCEGAGSLTISDEQFVDFSGSYPIYVKGCSTVVEDVSFTNIYQGPMLYGGNHEWSGIGFNNVSSSVMQFNECPTYYCPTQNPMFVNISNATFTNVAPNSYNSVLRFYTSNSTDAPITAYLDDIEMSVIGGDAISATRATIEGSNMSTTSVDGDAFELSSGAVANLTGISIDAIAGRGIYCSDCTLTLDNSSIGNTNLNGYYQSSGTASLSDVDFSNNGTPDASGAINLVGGELTGDSLNILNSVYDAVTTSSGSTLNLSNSTIQAALGDGLHIDGTTTLTTNNISDNAEFGLVCDVNSAVTCDHNSYSNNTSGEQTGCDSTCGQEPEAETTDPVEEDDGN